MKHDICPSCKSEINPFSEQKVILNIFNIGRMKNGERYWYCSEQCVIDKLSNPDYSKTQEYFPFVIPNNIVKTFLKSKISGEYVAIVDL